MEFSPEMTHHLLGWRESGQGDLQVQVTPMWGTVVALESRCVIRAKNVEETNMETEALVPLLSDCPEHFRFSSSCDIDIPSQFLSSLEPSCNSCVLFFFFPCFFLYIVIWGKCSSICSCQSTFGLLLFGRIYKSIWRIIIFKHHSWMPKCVQTISVNAICLRLI